MSPRSGHAALIIVLGLASLDVSAGSARAQAGRPAAAPVDLSAALEATTRLVTPSVVEIFTTTYAPGEGLVPRTADLVRRERGSGSGVIVDAEGFIVTNAHVVRGAQRLRVEVPLPPAGSSILSAGRRRSVPGRNVGGEQETDRGRGVNIMRVRDGKIVEAFGYMKG